MSHVNTVTITLAEYEELKSELKSSRDEINEMKRIANETKHLGFYKRKGGSFNLRANFEPPYYLFINEVGDRDGIYNVGFNLKNMSVGDKFLIVKTH